MVKIGQKHPMTGSMRGTVGTVTWIHPKNRYYVVTATFPPFDPYQKDHVVNEAFSFFGGIGDE